MPRLTPLDRRSELPLVECGVGELLHRTFDARSRSIDFVASTDALDSHGTIVEQDWDLSRYLTNPVVLLEHGRAVGGFFSGSGERDVDKLPIARSENIRVEGGKLRMKVVFPAPGRDERSDKVWNAIEDGRLNAVSVGFMPGEMVEEQVPDGDKVNEDGSPKMKTVTRIKKNVLYELSVVALPSNPEAVAERAVHVRTLCHSLLAGRPAASQNPFAALLDAPQVREVMAVLADIRDALPRLPVPPTPPATLAAAPEKESTMPTATAPVPVAETEDKAAKKPAKEDEATNATNKEDEATNSIDAIDAEEEAPESDPEPKKGKKKKGEKAAEAAPPAAPPPADPDPALAAADGAARALADAEALAEVREMLDLSPAAPLAEIASRIAALSEKRPDAALAERVIGLERDLASALAREADREVSWICASGERGLYGLGRSQNRKALTAFRRSDPAGFAEEYKAALDGLRAHDDPAFFASKVSEAASPVDLAPPKVSEEPGADAIDELDARVDRFMQTPKGAGLSKSQAYDAVFLRGEDRQ